MCRYQQIQRIQTAFQYIGLEQDYSSQLNLSLKQHSHHWLEQKHQLLLTLHR